MSCQQNQQRCQPPPKCIPKCPVPKCPPKCPLVSSCSESGDCCLSHHRPRLFHQRRHQSPDFCECEPSGGTRCCESSGDSC
ncbi:late cornified envelope protein 2A-like [Eubalaena glacialis]|uniref:late cornified envelope protein 2A-like n=1 Tax=Eubalaena glacialis TaxID=27606 RepID=UPI002A5A06FE|nr:late cornified envelope protein 2A-like [Eubalaena glacialis]